MLTALIDAKQFKDAFEDAQKVNKDLSSGTKPETVETSSTDPAGPSSATAKEATDKQNAATEASAPETEAVKEPVSEETK